MNVDEHFEAIEAGELLLVSVEPAGFEFVLRPSESARFSSGEPIEVVSKGIQRIVFISSSEFQMSLNNEEVEAPLYLAPMDILEVEFARLPKSIRPTQLPKAIGDIVSSLDFRIQQSEMAPYKYGLELLEALAQLSTELVSLFPNERHTFDLYENLSIRFLALGAIQIDYRISDFGRQLYVAAAADQALGDGATSTRRMLATNCVYPAELAAPIKEWAAIESDGSGESQTIEG